jgi:hypothetical protein
MGILIKFLVSTLLVCCLIGPGFATVTAFAAPASLVIAENSELTSAEAARLVQRKTGGKVLRVRDAGSSYQVKVLLPNGLVQSYSVNKVSGTVN